MKQSWTFWILVGTFFLFLTLGPVPAAAQEIEEDFPEGEAGQPNELGIALTARVGFDGYYKKKSWLPVTVLVSNDGPAVEGEIVVQGRGETTYRAPISLPNQSRKRIRLNVYNSGLDTDFRVQILNEDGSVVGLVRTNVIPLPTSDSLLYGVISSQPDAFEFLEKIEGGRTDVGVAFLDIVELPENPALWRDLDLLIINDVDSNQLTAPQRDALAVWVLQGGQLIVTGGASWQKTTGAFHDLLPVEVTGSRSASVLPAFAAQIGQPYRDEGPYVIAESRLVDGRSLFNEEGLPILARRSLGRGATYFMALDPRFAPLVDWNGSDDLWETIARRTPRQAFWEQGFIVDQEISDAVSGLPSLKLPPVLLLIGFVLLYIVFIGPANFIYLRSINRGERAWLTIPAIIAVFTITAYLMGLQFKGNSVLVNQMAVVTGLAGNETGQVEAAVGVYSPRRGSYDVIFEDDVVTRPLSDGSFSDTDLTIVHDTAVKLENTIIDVGEIGTYGARAVRPLPDIQAVVTANPETPGVIVTVTNNSGQTIENAGVYIGNNFIANDFVSFGTIEPGETVSKPISQRAILAEQIKEAVEDGVHDYQAYDSTVSGTSSSYQSAPFESYYSDILGVSSYYGDSVYFPRYELLESLFDNYGQEVVYEPIYKITLVGWTTQSQLDVQIDGGRFEESGVTLYFLEIPVDL